MNHETFEAHESLMKWINSHDAGKGEEIKARVRGILNAWYEDEFGPGYLESVMPDDEETVQDKARIFVNHLFWKRSLAEDSHRLTEEAAPLGAAFLCLKDPTEKIKPIPVLDNVEIFKRLNEYESHKFLIWILNKINKNK